MPEFRTVGPNEAIERLNKALAAVVRRHGESSEIRELLHAAATATMMLGRKGEQRGEQNRSADGTNPARSGWGLL